MGGCWKLVAAGLCVVLHLCGAQVCSVTEEADQTIYRVPPITASHCDFSWSNATSSGHTVMAHHSGGSEVVRSNNISTLITSQCFDWIVYRCKCRECTHYQLNCTTTCNAKHLPVEKKGFGRLYIGAVAFALLLLLVAAAVFFLVYRRRSSDYGSVKTDPERSSL